MIYCTTKLSQYLVFWRDAKHSSFYSEFEYEWETKMRWIRGICYIINTCISKFPLQSHERHGGSNQQQVGCLFKISFRLTSKKTLKLRVTGTLRREFSDQLDRFHSTKGQYCGKCFHVMMPSCKVTFSCPCIYAVLLQRVWKYVRSFQVQTDEYPFGVVAI